jgi:phosphoribosylanthranilate isomerase
MSFSEVATLPLREKFQIMEAIWAELSQRVENFGIPEEHKALLDARRERVATGESTLHDWDAVKHTIGHR